MAHLIPSAELPPIDRLRAIMHILRAPGGCSWDAEQTHESLKKHLVEEAYEVAEAIESGDRDDIVDELGDLLLQPVFHAEIASETGAFDFDDIAAAICEKLIRRHPHVFGDSTAATPDEVLAQWEQIKKTEKSGPDSPAPSGIPLVREGSETQQGMITNEPVFLLKKANEGLPALMAAQKIQKKVAGVGFDWPDLGPVIAKIQEEASEVEATLQEGSKEDVAEEIGDLLFAVVNLARKTGNEAELLLDRANRKFVRRFQEVERILARDQKTLDESSLEEMDQAWDAAKVAEKTG